MTITLLDLYNTAASQEWAMYDSDAASQNEMENSLIIALNKAITEILYSYPFSFRERTHVLFTIPKQNTYQVPRGIILKDENGKFRIKINSQNLEYMNNIMDNKLGIPEKFCIKGEKIIFYPTPSEKSIVTIDYVTLAVGEDKAENEIYALKNMDDKLIVPEHLEELLKNAIITRAMINSIASESDENYSAYKKQSETAYRLLLKYSKGVDISKKVKI